MAHFNSADYTLPGADGPGLMQRILRVTDAPVVFLSGQGREQDLASAFEMGAEDYIVKPFSPTELVARIGAALRRRDAPEREGFREAFQLERPGHRLRPAPGDGGRAGGSVDRNGVPLLYELSVNAGQVLSRST